ncbi:hypothetical protein [Phyllobacterium ifriqiyense]|uniref:hypothetical protein n=1 Tax=Phyllobacterium ifriqiyense TaxID=314238 RepID=UPI0033991F96
MSLKLLTVKVTASQFNLYDHGQGTFVLRQQEICVSSAALRHKPTPPVSQTADAATLRKASP